MASFTNTRASCGEKYRRQLAIQQLGTLSTETMIQTKMRNIGLMVMWNVDQREMIKAAQKQDVGKVAKQAEAREAKQDEPAEAKQKAD